MNLLTIRLTDKCNRDCIACPSKRWKLNNDQLTNEELISFTDRCCDPKNTLIELTGAGEPGCYEGINDLIKYWSALGYWIQVKTNGDYEILGGHRIKRISAWHGDIDHPPICYDLILLIKNQAEIESFNAKMMYCIKNNIPYYEINYRAYHLSLEERDRTDGKFIDILPEIRHFDGWTIILPDGSVKGCFLQTSNDNEYIDKINAKGLKWMPYPFKTNSCGLTCENVGNVERYYSEEEWKEIEGCEK